jgi:hypothetical protein
LIESLCLALVQLEDLIARTSLPAPCASSALLPRLFLGRPGRHKS